MNPRKDTSAHDEETTFRGRAITKAWIDMFKKHPYGDLYRLWLINPAVVQLALAVARRKKSPGAAILPVDLGLAILMQGLKAGDAWRSIAKLEGWHADLVKHGKAWRPFDGLRVLDLGCGVGYRAGILTALGAIYHGVDYNKAFVAIANSRWGGRNSSASFSMFDLETLSSLEPEHAAKALRGLAGDAVPDLVLAVNLFEHLKHPDALLGALRQIFTDAGRTSVLFLTTSQLRYYHRFSIAPKLGESCCSLPDTVPIVCLNGMEVRLKAHRRFQLTALLRDSGFLVLQESLLSLPPEGDSTVQQEPGYAGGALDVNWGLAPFRAFVATPLPPEEPVPEKIMDEVFAGSVLRLMSATHEGELVREIREKGRLVRLRCGERLIAKHNLGGCLYIVIDGHLGVPREPEIAFGRFDLFGELEANHAKPGEPKFGLFISDVMAGESGASVLVIPAPVASKLMDPEGCLNAALLGELRRRLLLRNVRLTKRRFGDKPLGKSQRVSSSIDWRLRRNTTKSGSAPELTVQLPLSPLEGRPSPVDRFLFLENTEVPFAELAVNKYDLGRLAGALLQLAELEKYELHRCDWAHCLLVDFDALKDITEIKEVSVVSELLRLLHCLGVVDTFPISGLRGTHCGISDDGDLASGVEDRLLSVVDRVGRSALARLPPLEPGWKAAVDEAGKLVTKWCAEATGKNLWSQMTERGRKARTKSPFGMTKTFRQFEESLLGFRAKPALHHSLRTTLEMLARVNRLLRAELPCFIIIQDLPLLRTLAFDPDEELEPVLFARGLICRPHGLLKVPKLSAVADGLHAAKLHGRIRMYAAAFCELVTNDLVKRDGTLRFSTNSPADAVPTPPSENGSKT